MYGKGPISKGFLLTSIVGFIISLYYIYPLNKPWGFTFCLMFVILFISSQISLARGAVDYQYALEKRARRLAEPRVRRELHYVVRNKKAPRLTKTRKKSSKKKAVKKASKKTTKKKPAKKRRR